MFSLLSFRSTLPPRSALAASSPCRSFAAVHAGVEIDQPHAFRVGGETEVQRADLKTLWTASPSTCTAPFALTVNGLSVPRASAVILAVPASRTDRNSGNSCCHAFRSLGGSSNLGLIRDIGRESVNCPEPLTRRPVAASLAPRRRAARRRPIRLDADLVAPPGRTPATRGRRAGRTRPTSARPTAPRPGHGIALRRRRCPPRSGRRSGSPEQLADGQGRHPQVGPRRRPASVQLTRCRGRSRRATIA